MINKQTIQGIIFDYGGTIDSNGVHWAEVIWEGYTAAEVPVSKEAFREAYVHRERTLAKVRLVLPQHTFYDMLAIKTRIQLDWLIEHQQLEISYPDVAVSEQITEYCYQYAKQCVDKARPIIEQLAEQYPLVLVSNFYGNIESVLKDFSLDTFFRSIVESAVVGVRKPDPEIFRLGVNELQVPAGNCVVIGDSYDKDIVPATTIGCQTVWLKNTGWSPYKGDETADSIIEGFEELKTIFF
ncbi:MAG: HAD family hydrolase [Tannerellaceae bacterium]|nr:HAD family hydrolase [Tannerellaceae bacterium]